MKYVLWILLAIALIVGVVFFVQYNTKKNLIKEIMGIAATHPNSDVSEAYLNQKSIAELKDMLTRLKNGEH